MLCTSLSGTAGEGVYMDMCFVIDVDVVGRTMERYGGPGFSLDH